MSSSSKIPKKGKKDVIDTIQLKPVPGFIESLGSNHSFESAIADIVDNSIDAGATRVAVRLTTQDDKLVQVEVADNGGGMNQSSIDQAMTLGHQRAYRKSDLGHFGVGLKSASFGHSNILTVWSSQPGQDPVGRRINRKRFTQDFTCEILSKTAATGARKQRRHLVDSPHGTTVIWSDLRSTYKGQSSDEAREWITKTELSVTQHLGVTFHRVLEKSSLDISIVVDEIEFPDQGIPMRVNPIDPFAYPKTGRPGYPKIMTAKAGDRNLQLKCHIWPPKTDIPGYRFKGKRGEDFQGFYIYRHDRLLQIGGWSEAANPTKQKQLARVVIDDPTLIGHLFTMNPEKSGLRIEAEFRDALSRASARDGTTFDKYLEDAEECYKTANKRTSRRHPVITPNQGFSPAVRKQIKNETGLMRSSELNIRWTRLPKGEFFAIDYSNHKLMLNQRYRSLFAPQGGSLNDAPLVKTLLFLLTHQVFEGSHLGPKEKDNIALWRSVLGAAVEAEEEMR